MDNTTAKVILSNLRERIEIGSDGKYRLAGLITLKELEALDHFINEVAPEPIAPTRRLEPTAAEANEQPQKFKPDPAQPVAPEIHLNLSTLSLPDSNADYRVCLDFGTAMSKATFVHDDDDDDLEDIQVLKLGVPGDQENIDEYMLVSSVLIDADGVLWFGQKAVEQSQKVTEGDHLRMDNIKRALSEGNLGEVLDSRFNPTSYLLTYEDIVLAYLSFFTWAVNYAVLHDVDAAEVAPNFKRRFAMPCFPRVNARLVEAKLKQLLGEAQVLADTFGDDLHQGLPLESFLAALKSLRSEKRNYPFIDGSVTEPLGVAGSLLSWRGSHDSLALVVDIGAGTSDFSLYRLHVTENEDGSFKSVAGEVDGTAHGITEAGNHLDNILKAYTLSKAKVNAQHPRYINIIHALDRDIRHYKEVLFNRGSALVVLYTNDAVDVSLDDFLQLDAVKAFGDSLRSELVKTMQDAHPDWVHWVRANPSRYLTIVLTGGGAALPMAKKLAEGTITAHGITIPVVPAKAFPSWLEKDYPDLETPYSRIAVSLGGARKNIIHPMQRPLTATGNGIGGYTLERFPSRGN